MFGSLARIARSDYAINAGAFAIYIATQQLIILPTISRVADTTNFAHVVLFASIYAIITNVLGEELGNAMLVRSEVYKTAKWRARADFLTILAANLLLVSLGALSVLLFTGLSSRLLLLTYLITVIGVIRSFMLSYMRALRAFSAILSVQSAYAAGGLLGLVGLLWRIDSLYVPFLVAESLAVIVAIAWSLRMHGLAYRWVARSPGGSASLSLYVQFAVSAVILNSVGYLDRIVVLPLLGAQAMAAYFVASSMSKLVALGVTPITGVMLARMGVMESSAKSTVAYRFLSRLPVLVLGALLLTLASGVAGVKVLYPQLATEALQLVLPCAVAAALGMATSIARPVLMRFFPARWLLVSNVLYGAILLVLVIVGSTWGVVGFAWAIAVSRCGQLALYSWALLRGSK